MAALIDQGKVQFTYKHLVVVGQESQWAAEASECAADQGKFWAFHDYLFSHQKGENQGTFSLANLKKFAVTLGLDSQKFNTCLDTHQYKEKVGEARPEAQKLGLPGTPSFTVNGKFIQSQNNNDVVNAVKEAVK